MSNKKTKHRLVPLETLYPDRPAREKPKTLTPFYKPGKAAEIPFEPQDNSSIRYLQASTILKDLKSLQGPLEEIVSDSKFISSSMISALQIPQAIETTFNRIHGRIYDIQRQVEYKSDSKDEVALVIQTKFRQFNSKRHYQVIQNAIHNTIRRDCATIHESLLSFLLAYAKFDDHFKMLLNRHFLVRNRNALRFWREWSITARQDEDSRISRVDDLHEEWLNRRVSIFLRNWKWLSFSRHSRKALQRLQSKINSEAQKRLAERAATPFTQLTFEQQQNLNLPILEQLAIEREGVIIDFGIQNYNYHTTSIVFRFWRRFVEQCRSANRSGNAIAREFWTKRKKRSFFQAWFSLSVGRVVVFGGYTPWFRPHNRRKQAYQDRYRTQLYVLREWKHVIERKKQIIRLQRNYNRAFLKSCFRAFRKFASERRQRLQQMMESYIKVLRTRTHRVFQAWHFYTVKEKVRCQPSKFMLARSKILRDFRTKTKFFRRWNVRWLNQVNEKEKEQLEEVELFVRHWTAAGKQMKESMVLISQLNAKLTNELVNRKKDLQESKTTVDFMRNEQAALAIAMENMKRELEKLHQQIGKSSMRYFVEIKPVHGNVVKDVPAALAQYTQQKEAEKQRILAQKAAMQQPEPVQVQPKKQTSQAKNRRKAAFHVKSSTKLHVPKRNSNQPQMPIIPEDDDDQE